MAPKKTKKTKNTFSSSSSSSCSTPSSPAPPSSSTSPSDDDPSIRHECKWAFESLRRGNNSKALKIIRDSLSLHPNSVLLRYVQATILFKSAIPATDTDTCRGLLIQIAESSRDLALNLSPNSLSCAVFHAHVIFELANIDVIGYQEVIQECERGLSIENPTVQVIEEEEDSSPEMQIKNKREELRELIEKCKNNLLKEKMKQVVNRGPTRQMKNDIKTLQLSKKQIEMSATVARQEFEIQGLVLLDGNQKEKGKLKNPKKFEPNVDIVDRVKTYWNNMSVENKRALLKVRVEDLEAHFSKNTLAMELFMEAISFAKENKKWNFWKCCVCGDSFLDSELGLKHVRIEHIGNLSEKLASKVPDALIDDCYIKASSFSGWKPVDRVAAMKIMEDRSRIDSADNRVPRYGKWPICDDSEREKILETIYRLVQLVMRNKCLGASHVLFGIGLTLPILEVHIPNSHIVNNHLHRTLLSTCFLEASELKDILHFWEDQASACALSCLSEDDTDMLFRRDEVLCVKGRIVFDSDLSCLLLDERLLKGKLTMQYKNAVANDGTAVSSAVEGCESNDLPASDDFFDWLFGGPTVDERLKSWRTLREAYENHGTELFQILKREFNRLQYMCERKCDCLSFVDPLYNVRRIVLREYNKRMEIPDYDPKSYLSLFLDWQKEPEREAYELKIVRGILKEAQEDTEIEIALCNQAKMLGAEICRVDAIILMSDIVMRQTERIIDMVSTYDYRSIMVHLLKSFIRTSLEDLVDKDAIEKSEAAMQALLSEPLDTNNKTKRGRDNVRQVQGKSKDKNKKKVNKKAKDFKGAGVSEKHLSLDQKDSKQVCFPVSHGGDYPDPKIGDPVSTDEIEQIERREYEELERKLEEKLEYQRRFENEAKQKHLAEHCKNTGGNIAENVVEAVAHGEDVGSGEQQQLKHYKSVPLPCRGTQWASDVLDEQSGEPDQLEDSDLVNGEDSVSSKPGEDVGSSVQQQLKQSEPVPFPSSGTQLEDSELVHDEDAGSDEEKQSKDPEPVPLPVKSRGADIFNYESDESDEQLNEPEQLDDSELANGKDVDSDEKHPNHAEPVPLPGKSWDRLTLADVFKYEGGESYEKSGEPEQLEDSELANGEDAVSSKPGEDVGSSEQQKHNCSQLGSVPNHIWWGKITWADVFNADNDNSNEKSGEPDQLEDSELVNGEDSVSSKPGEDVGSSVQQQLKQSEPVPLPCNGTQLGDSELAHDEDVGSDEEQQPKDPEPVPLAVKSRGADLFNYESDESDEQLNELEQLDDSELANGKDVGSDEERPNHAEPVPLPGKSWDILTLADVFKYEGGESYKKSSEPEQLEDSELANGEDIVSSKPEEDVGSSMQQQLKQSEPVPLPCCGTQLENSELDHGEDVGSDEEQQPKDPEPVPLPGKSRGKHTQPDVSNYETDQSDEQLNEPEKLDYLEPCSWSRCCLL